MFEKLILRKKLKQSLIGWLGNALVPGRRYNNLDTLTIFTYHNITNLQKENSKCDDLFFINLPFTDFKKQVTWINEKFNVISFDDVMKGTKHQGRPSALITFDDGYKSVYDLAFPLLRNLGITATIFLTGDHVAKGVSPWISRLHYVIDNTKIASVSYAGHSYELSKTKGLQSFLFKIKGLLRELPMLEMQQRLSTLEKMLDVEVPTSFTETNFLNTSEINDLCRSGWIVGNHSQSHRLMAGLEINDQYVEINDAQSALSVFEGHRDIFAVPFGGRDTFSKSTIEIAKKCGIKFLLTTIPDDNVSVGKKYVLGRMICETFSFSYFKFLATGRKKRVLDLFGLRGARDAA